MKFIVDAQLPYGIALFLREKGYDAIHTNDLPDKERTKDSQIRLIAAKEDRIVVTKDYDFIDSHILIKNPKKILLISTGNIKNKQMFALWQSHWELIIHLLETCNLVELNNNDVIGK